MNQEISARPQYSIPSWIKNTAKLWSDGKISDSEYLQGLQWLIDHKILKVPQVTTVQNKTKITNTPKVPQPAKIQNSTSQKPNLPITYVNKIYGFSIIQPYGWTKKIIDAYSINGNIVLFTSPIQKSGNILSISISLKTSPDIQSTPINQIEMSFENGLHTAFATQDSFSLTKKSTMTVNGQKAFYFEYVVGGGTSTMDSKQVVIPHQDKLFIITYTADQTDYNQHMDQFTNSLSSFKFS